MIESWHEIGAAIAAATGTSPGILRSEPVSGGCINDAYLCRGTHATYFVKTNSPPHLDHFEAESASLEAIASTGTIRVPRSIASGIAGGTAFLVLEALQLTGGSSPASYAAMGAQLADLHSCLSPDGRFGWHRDNAIGGTPQRNPWCPDWPTFYARHRLAPQLELADAAGFHFPGAAELIERVPSFFEGISPQPALLHGDLWSGNAAIDDSGTPVVFDPASYYGDPETDLAFTRLFGGFPPEFYAAYDAALPPLPGRDARTTLYNLYHVLNHANLFGGSYATQANHLIQQLIA
ncbi:fructosamine kinase family protein [soil metagenome]